MGFMSDYTPEEREGVEKHRTRRALIAFLLLALCFIGYEIRNLVGFFTCHQLRGTWVLHEDYADGFHREDETLIFQGSTIRCSKHGESYMKRDMGSWVLSKEKAYVTNAPQMHWKGDTLTLIYFEYDKADQEPVQIETGRKQFVRISREQDLTPEQREDLY